MCRGMRPKRLSSATTATPRSAAATACATWAFVTSILESQLRSAASNAASRSPPARRLGVRGSLDAAFVAIAGQIELSKGVTRLMVGVNRIGVLARANCDLRSTQRREFAGRTVVTCTTDCSGEELDGRVVALGATPYRAATAETAVRLGRLLGHPVVMPRSLLRTYLTDGDRELVTTRFGGPRLALVARVPLAPYWKRALPTVGKELGLSGVSAHTGPGRVGRVTDVQVPVSNRNKIG